MSGLARRKELQGWDVVLDHERAARLQMRCGVEKGLDLLVLGSQVRDRVADEVDERERLIHDSGRIVPDGHVDAGAAGPGTKLLDHRLRLVDAVDPNSAPTQRQGDATGANAEFEGRTGPGKLGEEVHCWVQHRRI